MQNNTQFDIIIIGGGATGLGSAIEAASRGFKTLLLEGHDYGKGTSSKSTKLIHGGLRYLANMDIALVKEGLEERYYFLQNAPHLAYKINYLIPFYSFSEKLKYLAGVKIYDSLAGRYNIGKAELLSKAEVIKHNPSLKSNNLCGGIFYNDGSFDDTRMLMSLLKTFEELGGTAYNYHQVTGFEFDNNQVCGVKVINTPQNTTTTFYAKHIINATGTLTDNILTLAEPNKKHHNVMAAQGTHLVFDKNIFPTETAILLPKTDDNRVMFVLPWHDKLVVGTTDVQVEQATLDPIYQKNEIDFILHTINQYSTRKITLNDVQAIYTGQRPLVQSKNTSTSSAKVSRKHEIIDSHNGIISIVGGKWTIYRRMGQDVVDYIVQKNKLTAPISNSKTLKINGYTLDKNESYPLNVYGSNISKIKQIMDESNSDKLHSSLPYYQAEVIYHIRYEQAKTIEDILLRRTRAAFLNAKATLEAKDIVAKILAKELHYSAEVIEQQKADFEQYINAHFLPITR